MSKIDTHYRKLAMDIMNSDITDIYDDVRPVWADGSKACTNSVIGRQIRLDNSEVPILTCKKVAWKTAIKEILWIWQQKSNKVSDLNAVNVKIWNEWEQEDGTIGKAYGYQMGKKCRAKNLGHVGTGVDGTPLYSYLYMDQVDYIIHELQNNPTSRRIITSLWNINDLDDMALEPCVWNTHWLVKNNRLTLIVNARSNDIALGAPFNIFQYNVLQRMIAQVCNLELGEMIYNMDDAHIYTRHFEGMQKLITQETYDAPELWINPEITNFYDFTIDDFKLIDYKYGKKINFEVAI